MKWGSNLKILTSLSILRPSKWSYFYEFEETLRVLLVLKVWILVFVIVHSSFIHTSIRFYLYFTQISFIFSSYFIYISFIEKEGPRKIQRQPLQYPPLLGPGWNYRTSPLSGEKLGPRRRRIRSIGAFLGLQFQIIAKILRIPSQRPILI